MTDFAAARRMMVDGQVRTADVTDRRIIAAMLGLPRERFFPADKSQLAYLDLDAAVSAAGRPVRCLLKPMVLAKLIQATDVGDGDRVLDVGCAKGFLLHDLRQVVPGLDVVGLDISGYAIAHAMPDVRPRLVRASAEHLPFADRSVDVVISINTVHNLDRPACVRALVEIERVSRGHRYVQVDSWLNEVQREKFERWQLTALTYSDPAGWRRLFAEAGYHGDYYWTVTE